MQNSNSDLLQCPCGARMVLRHARDTGRAFYGCSQYPTCKNTIGADKDGSPIGIIADDEIKRLRKTLNDKLDQWYPVGSFGEYCERSRFIETATGKGKVNDLTALELRRLIQQL